ncbi:MAG: hypothetical protein DNFNHJIP_00524 [Candidatus Argoarchaeum ethanivorans]|uniref:Uncharacterized protein n=1 Tax=Candidatus Argoarchaeum ethanivorans TaxID=2608793 RepID=A0A812A041_9EURY|nr:MAG: hypothetical protein DNFNHJIP_00524 [Candidatus Argoarchaeum ethanivorans]
MPPIDAPDLSDSEIQGSSLRESIMILRGGRVGCVRTKGFCGVGYNLIYGISEEGL